jgi:PAS domain S-box-containing protein
MAETTSRTESYEDIYAPAFDAARDLLEADRAAVLLFDDSDRMRFQAWRGLSDSYRAAVDGHSPWARAHRDARPILVYDVTADDTLADYRPAFAAERIRAVGFVPLIARRTLLGKFMLYWDQPRTFSARDDALAAAIGIQIAEALERARLHELERRDYEAERVARERAEAAEARMTFLAEASVQLSSSLDYEATLRKVAELAVPRLADWCVIDIAGEGEGALNRVAIVHSDPAKVEFAEAMRRRYPPKSGAQLGVAQVMRTGRAVLHRDDIAALISEVAHDAEHVWRIRALDLRSAMTVPITAGGRTFGVLSFFTAESMRRLTEADLQVAEELGRRTGIAIENARLYGEEKRMRLEAQAAEQRRAAIEQKLRVALGAGRMGVWEWSIATGRVTWSPTLEMVHGLSPGTFEGTFEAYQRDVHPDDRDGLLRSLKQALESQREYHVEYRIVRPDGEVRWVAGYGDVLAHEDGLPVAMTGVCMDITERKQAEHVRQASAAQLEQTLRELEQTLRDNELFAGILAHDLRNPLAAILTAVQLLAQAPRGADERASGALQHVLASGARMTRLIDQLLDFTRARVAGAFELARHEVDLVALFDQVAAEIEGAHPHWRLAREVRGDCGGEWDPDRLLQVVSNLIANAGQHGTPGEIIRVTLDGRDPDCVAWAIHNRGEIPAALMTKLFVPFGGLREGKAGGLGLGLFIAQRIVAAHGGHIDVASSAASGTTFSVRLPRRASER